MSDPVYDDVWDEPIPFGINDPSGTTSESFPVDAFPEVPRVMAEAVARTIQVDPALPAMTILGVGSAAIAYKTMVVDGDWTEETSLWSFCVARSGERKSQTQSRVLAPIYAVDSERRARERELIAQGEAALKIIEARHADAIKAASKAKSEMERVAAETLVRELATQLQAASDSIQKETRLIVNDVTPEYLATALADNNPMLIASSEGGLLDNFMGRYSAKGIPNLDLLNGSFSGDYFGGGRAGRTVRPIERPVLAMALLPQPVVLAALAGNHFLAQKGTLSRFIFWVAKELAGTRSPEARPRPDAAIAAWDILLRDLLSIPPTDDPYIIRPSREATEVLMEWRREAEALLLTESNEGMRSWLVRSSGQQQRLAALMHFFEHGASGILEEIGPKSAERAATLIRALEPHARLAFDMIDESGVVSRARRVVEWSARRGGADETRRDISRGPLKGLSGSDRDEVLKELEGRGWVRLERKETGGRPSDIVQFHPLSGSGLKGQKGQKVTKGSQEGLLSPSESFGTRNGKTEKGGGDLAEELFREAMRGGA